MIELSLEVPVRCAECGNELDTNTGKEKGRHGETIEVILVVPCPYCAQHATAILESAATPGEVFDRR